MLIGKAPRDSYFSLCHVTGAADSRSNSKLSLAPYKREGLSSQRDILNLLLALGPIYQSIHWEETMILQ